jgi:rRNA small subunit pseudouridine methyltransferase Nep1
MLLDRSYHHAAMKRLEQSEKRGRPDIAHFSLLEAQGSPLNKERLLTVYVHTINDHVIWVNPEARLPRDCIRFSSLIGQLFESKHVPLHTEKPLLTLKKQTLHELIQDVKPTHTLALSRLGQPQTLETCISNLSQEIKPTVLVGGFPRGHFSKTTMKLADKVICIDPEMLETWTMVSRVIYEFERALSLPKQRIDAIR